MNRNRAANRYTNTSGSKSSIGQRNTTVPYERWSSRLMATAFALIHIYFFTIAPTFVLGGVFGWLGLLRGVRDGAVGCWPCSF